LTEYIFTIRSGDQLFEAERAVALDGDEAALDYACELVRHLRSAVATTIRILS
jgi:hypothetical protein